MSGTGSRSPGRAPSDYLESLAAGTTQTNPEIAARIGSCLKGKKSVVRTFGRIRGRSDPMQSR